MACAGFESHLDLNSEAWTCLGLEALETHVRCECGEANPAHGIERPHPPRGPVSLSFFYAVLVVHAKSMQRETEYEDAREIRQQCVMKQKPSADAEQSGADA